MRNGIQGIGRINGKKGIVVAETERPYSRQPHQLAMQQRQTWRIHPSIGFRLPARCSLSIMKWTFSLTEGLLHKRRSAASRASALSSLRVSTMGAQKVLP